MPSGSYIQVAVKCPYYKTDNGKDRITCEGLTPGAQLQSYYRKPKDFAVQMKVFCCSRYWNCEICAALDEKHKEDDDE